MQEPLTRQIEPADLRILIEVAQDVGQLQRAAEVMRKQDSIVPRETEYPHRQASDGAGHAITVEIERGEVRRADILRYIHFHTVDDREEILALQVEFLDRWNIIQQSRRRPAPIQGVDVFTPLL